MGGTWRNHLQIPHPEMPQCFCTFGPTNAHGPWSMYGCFTKHLVRMQFSLPLTEDLSSECQRLPLVLCQAVLRREKTKANQFSVSSMLVHPTKNLPAATTGHSVLHLTDKDFHLPHSIYSMGAIEHTGCVVGYLHEMLSAENDILYSLLHDNL